MECLMTITSKPMTSMVFMVSLRLSPFCTLLNATGRFTVSALRYFPAISKEVLVLVLGS